MRRTGFGGTLRVNIVTVLISLLLYHGFYIPAGLIWTRVVPSASMRPTLFDGDYVLGFPKSDAKAPARRGDVVVFSLPSDPATEYVKRVVGLPGDRVQMIDGVLFINGEPVRRERIDSFVDQSLGGSQEFTRWRETLPNGVVYQTLTLSKPGFYSNTPAFTVPPGHYFMLGDNRDNSLDSRVTSKVGFIPADKIVGRAGMIYFSIDHNATTVMSSVRWGRLFKIVR